LGLGRVRHTLYICRSGGTKCWYSRYSWRANPARAVSSGGFNRFHDATQRYIEYYRKGRKKKDDL